MEAWGHGLPRPQFNHKMKKALTLLILVLATALGMSAAQTATQLANRTAELLKRADGVSVAFTMASGGHSVKGEMKAAGSRFAISTPEMATWFDGKTMWTYSSRTGETTVTLPTDSEIAETNPLRLISANSSSFTASYAERQPSSGKKIILSPKKKSLGVKKVEVTVNERTYQPTIVTVYPDSGSPTTITITSFSTKATVTDADFKYPAKKYPKATLVDLR